MTMPQGGLANSSGNTLEKTIMGTLQSKGFEIVNYREWNNKKDKYGTELLLRNVPFTTIYEHDGNTEFLLKSAKYSLDIRIECKWQQSPGSVDEKFPYLYLNCVERMPESHIIIVIDGGGAKAGAIEWLRHACENKLYTTTASRAKTIEIMNLQEFLKWCNNKFR